MPVLPSGLTLASGESWLYFGKSSSVSLLRVEPMTMNDKTAPSPTFRLRGRERTT